MKRSVHSVPFIHIGFVSFSSFTHSFFTHTPLWGHIWLFLEIGGSGFMRLLAVVVLLFRVYTRAPDFWKLPFVFESLFMVSQKNTRSYIRALVVE